MFKFIIKRFGFLKHIPLIALVFDSQLKLLMLLINSPISYYLDEMEQEVATWPGCTISLHKYGGTQFNYKGNEIGHVHSNGLLDILFDLKIKQRLMADGKIGNHHTFIKSGWISFHINTRDDKEYAIKLLNMAYKKHAIKSFTSQIIPPFKT